MKKVHNFKKLSFLLISGMLFLFAGCASKVSQTNTIQKVSDTQNYKNVSVVIQSNDDNVKQQNSYQKTTQKLLIKIKQKLLEENIFESIVNPEKNGKKVDISVNIKQLKVVSKAARLMSGIMTGEAIISGSIILKDAETQKTIGSINFMERSGTSGGIFTDDTDNQIEIISNMVINLFKKDS